MLKVSNLQFKRPPTQIFTLFPYNFSSALSFSYLYLHVSTLYNVEFELFFRILNACLVCTDISITSRVFAERFFSNGKLQCFQLKKILVRHQKQGNTFQRTCKINESVCCKSNTDLGSLIRNFDYGISKVQKFSKFPATLILRETNFA